MSITITKTPNSVSPCGRNNPIAFVCESNRRIVTDGVACVRNIRRIAYETEGEYLVLSWGVNSVQITFTNTPDDIGTTIPLGLSLPNVVLFLQKNYLINRDFVVSSPLTNILRFTARSTGTDFELSIDKTHCVGYTAYSGDVDAIDEEANDNFAIMCQLYVDGNLTAVGTSDEYNGEAVFYHESVLRSLFRKNTDLPVFGQTTITNAENIVKSFYCRFAEIYGNEPSVKMLYDSAEYKAINAEISAEKIPGFNFVDDIASKKYYLTNRSQTIRTLADTHQYLYFFNYLTAITTFEAIIIAYYTDGTTQTITKSFSCARNSAVIIPVGHNQLSLADIYDGDVYYYTVQVNETTFDLLAGRKMTFVVEETPFFQRSFIFQNKLGGFDTVLCSDQEQNISAEKEQRNIFIGYNFASGDAQYVSDIKDSHHTMTVRSIPLTKADAESYSEILTSPYVYIVGASGYIRVDITTSETLVVDENEDLQVLEFSYRYSLQNSDAFIKPNGDYSNDFSNDFDI